jgi:hypothetical protein
MEPGNVVRLRNFRHYTGEVLGIQTMDYTAPAGHVFLVLLLGTEEKNKPNSVGPEELLRRMGWVFNPGRVALAAEPKLVDLGGGLSSYENPGRNPPEKRAALAAEEKVCPHENTVVEMRGCRRLVEGEVDDDFHEVEVCKDCGTTLAAEEKP